ncbi:hypothetical protein HYQ44_009068 [Verticillium longisporum]|nr:hypothetical protein HYQ44_009068 [Verticillium longisporum]
MSIRLQLSPERCSPSRLSSRTMVSSVSREIRTRALVPLLEARVLNFGRQSLVFVNLLRGLLALLPRLLEDSRGEELASHSSRCVLRSTKIFSLCIPPYHRRRMASAPSVFFKRPSYRSHLSGLS